MSLAIGVDVGGTKVAAGVVDGQGRIIAKLKRSTPAASPPLTEDAIADVVTELLDGHEVEAVGSAPPGSSTGAGHDAVRAQPGLARRAAQESGRGAPRAAGRRRERRERLRLGRGAIRRRPGRDHWCS